MNVAYKEYVLTAYGCDYVVKLTLNVDKCLELLSVAIPGYKHDDMPMIQSAYEYRYGKFTGTTDELLEWFACEFATKAAYASFQFTFDPYEDDDGWPSPLRDYVTIITVDTPDVPDYSDWSIS